MALRGGPHLELAGATLRLTRAAGRLGCDIEIELTAGTLNVDARPGVSTVLVTCAGQRLDGTVSRFTVEVSPDGGRASVRDGLVRRVGRMKGGFEAGRPGMPDSWRALELRSARGHHGEPGPGAAPNLMPCSAEAAL